MITTDNQYEIFDLVDEDDNVTGQATRKELHHNKKLIHRSIYVAVFNKKGELFLQQRSETKDTDPLKWTISCTGHVKSGDSYKKAARRELQEELGVNYSLEYVTKFIVRYPSETEMTVLFKTYGDGPFKLQLQEIKKGEFISREKLRRAINNRFINLALSGKFGLEKLGWL